MTMMREKAVKDLAQYGAEMKELERVIAHESSLKEFMTTKCNERNGQDDGHEMRRRQCKTGTAWSIIVWFWHCSDHNVTFDSEGSPPKCQVLLCEC